MGSKRFTAPRLKKCANTNEDKDMPRKSRKTPLTARERFEIESLIAQHGDETDLGWQYHDGWSDLAVGKLCDETHKVVSNTRYKTFGNLAGHARRSGEKLAELLDRMEAVERSNADLTALVKRLRALDESTGAGQQSWKDESSGNGIVTSERAKACL